MNRVLEDREIEMDQKLEVMGHVPQQRENAPELKS
jgi:hypothetical protein